MLRWATSVDGSSSSVASPIKIGRHVRIESEVVEALIEAGRVEVAEVASASGRRRLTVEEIREEELRRWRTSASTR